jgi:cyclic beta-1,2-glucan synthetase
VEFFNSLGGFAEGGRDYVTILGPGQSTPVPWINVIANPTFGFLVSAEGGGYAWSVNSREHQLTPWSNDPVTDQPTKLIFGMRRPLSWCPPMALIRDETATIQRAMDGLQLFRAHPHGIVGSY